MPMIATGLVAIIGVSAVMAGGTILVAAIIILLAIPPVVIALTKRSQRDRTIRHETSRSTPHLSLWPSAGFFLVTSVLLLLYSSLSGSGGLPLAILGALWGIGIGVNGVHGTIIHMKFDLKMNKLVGIDFRDNSLHIERPFDQWLVPWNKIKRFHRDGSAMDVIFENDLRIELVDISVEQMNLIYLEFRKKNRTHPTS